MSDFEDLDFFLKSWISEEKRKRRKDPKREKKQKNRTKKDASVQKKKKKNKDSLQVGKENKEKKKKKRKKVEEKPEASEKKSKRKKKVLFDLSPEYIGASRPVVCSRSRPGLQDESQSDDVNSQDLFITQKTFRTPEDETCRTPEDETCRTPDNETFRTTENETCRTPDNETFRTTENETCRTPDNETFRTTENETCSGETSSPAEGQQKNVSSGSQGLQTELKLKPNLTQEKTLKPDRFLDDPVLVVDPVLVDPSKENFCSTANTSTQTENFFTTELSSYLRFCRSVPETDLKPLDLSLPKTRTLSLPKTRTLSLPKTRNLDLPKTRTLSLPETRTLSLPETRDLSLPETRTLSLPKTRTLSLPKTRDLSLPKTRNLSLPKTRDLSLPKTRNLSLPKTRDLDRCWSPVQVKDEGDPDVLLSGSSQHKEGRLKTSSGSRSVDSSSSEDNEPPGRKLDLNQVRAVQMRLNESFFFKTKGDGGSPRPESPLMKLALGRDVKKKKKIR